MVRFKNVTGEKITERGRTNEVRELMEYTLGDYFRIEEALMGVINVHEERDNIFTIFTNDNMAILKKEEYKHLFEKFGRIYEKKFRVKNLEIAEDYS